MNTKKFNRGRSFFVAVFLAAVYGIDRWGVKEVAGAVKMLLIALCSRKGRVSKLEYYRRMRACWRCPLFHVKLQTCGSPLAEDPGLGCWCHMPVKARTPEATCWIDENTNEDYQDSGWKTI